MGSWPAGSYNGCGYNMVDRGSPKCGCVLREGWCLKAILTLHVFVKCIVLH